MRCRQSLAKIKNKLQSQSLGATGGVENITEGLSGQTLASFFKVFMKNFHPILPSPPFSCLGIQPRWEKGVSRLTCMRMLKRPHCRPSTTWQNHTWHKNWIGVPFPDRISHSRIYSNNKGFKLLYGFSTFFSRCSKWKIILRSDWIKISG